MVPGMDEGPPSSYLLLAKDTPVFGSDGGVAGKVKEVLCDPGNDIFDGLVLTTPLGDRYLAADQVTAIHERGVDVAIATAQARELPLPSPHRRIKYDVAADERPWVEVMHWLHDHLTHLVHSGDARLRAARERLAQHEEALKLARENPRLALEAGVGRPDLPGAYDGGLVDLNHAPREVIDGLPTFDTELAGRLVAVRERVDGFASLEDLGTMLDLPGDQVEHLRDHVVFLPR
jgi:DNA uptake protein ComE-like DNA-binding protein